MAADNKLLGQFDLVGIPPAPRGLPQIEVRGALVPGMGAGAQHRAKVLQLSFGPMMVSFGPMMGLQEL